MGDNVLVERDGRVATLTLNRPEVHNALNAQTMIELGAAIEEVAGDDTIQVVIVTGAGDMAFAAGADISELVRLDTQTGFAMAQRGQRFLRRLETMGKPSIAAVNGFALGGGLEIAMSCTIRVSSDRAKFGQPEVNLGIIPGYAGTQRLSRLVGKGVAMDLTLTGRIIKADEALRIGLVTRVVPRDEVMSAARVTAETLMGKGPLALRAAMDVVDRGYDLGFDDACRLEATSFAVLCATEDMREGLNAFLEKRKPNFKGK